MGRHRKDGSGSLVFGKPTPYVSVFVQERHGDGYGSKTTFTVHGFSKDQVVAWVEAVLKAQTGKGA